MLAKPEHENRISHICTDNVKTGIANTLGELGRERAHFCHMRVSILSGMGGTPGLDGPPRPRACGVYPSASEDLAERGSDSAPLRRSLTLLCFR